ncbi:EAL domain-containing protein [Planomonospora sp. ID67723]|uniref:putative bifunctional diguanylate cyclase/phosphodiesterase n=1 Tax=Planomonospora sp. ID67723 TaxID=2738134 RepID=UPI0018C3D124|nr:EAL domain-containing protein [Planomonospora sp. ID67723]MBG0829488.1 EAL domain-containing protein [Planomonospora sp. ID67723]
MTGALRGWPASPSALLDRARARPMLWTLGAICVFSLGWFALGLVLPPAWPMVAWIPVVVSVLLAATACVRVSRSASLTPVGRTFWRRLGISMALLSAGLVNGVYDMFTTPGVSMRYVGPLTMGLYLGALLITIWALLKLPIRQRSRRALLTLGLDAGVVMLAAALFAWHLVLRAGPDVMDATGSSWTVLLVIALCFVEVLTAVKLVLTGAGPLHRSVLTALGMSVVAGAASSALAPLLHAKPYLATTHVGVPLIAFFTGLAVERQRRVAAAPAAAPQRGRRPFSLLPYAAVAAADILLLISAHQSDPQIGVIAAGTIAITALVVLRQIVSFYDNASLQDQLSHQATHDALTRLANRALFTDRAVGALAESPHRGVALALIDLDDFKTVNDRLGHAVGDALLVAVADRLRECVRRGDTVARLGGDEFAVLLRDVTSAEADRITERIIAALGAPVRASGHELLVQASIGLVDGGSGMDASELLRRADVAMYAAKEQGKSRYVRYTDDMDTRAVEHARVGAELRHALSAGELFLLYQPVVTLPGGGLSGVEALVRWRHPERGLVSPAEFIPVAERTGMIVEVGAWVLGEACRQMAAWKQRYGDAAPAKMSVNVSARQLREPAFGQTVAEALEATGLRPADLLLEITETAVFDGGPALETVQAVQALGVPIALDDFGTGHSSLGLLRTCPVDVLKVDKLFIDGVTGTAEQAAIASSLAHIAQVMRLRAVAEGVETAEQAERLYQLGYRLAQGFHFAPPLSVGNIEQILDTRAESPDPSSWERPALAG